MTTGPQLAVELTKVAAPTHEGFTVREVPGAPGYSIGRGPDGVIALLTPADSQPDPPTRLRSLTLEPRIRLRIENAGGACLEEERGLIELRLTDAAMLDPFLAVAAAMVRMLGKSPRPTAVSAGMRRLVKIFDRTEAPRGSVLGLFGELVVIATASDPGEMVDAWHAHAGDQFDFADEGSRLEVKTTTKDVREHMFGLRQLRPVDGVLTRVVSVMTTETHAGTSIGELVSRVEAAMDGNAERQVKVHQQVASTLGKDWIYHLGHRFDEVQAASSILVLDPDLIPKVADPPVAVVSVSLTVDCSHVPIDENPSGLAALVRSVRNE